MQKEATLPQVNINKIKTGRVRERKKKDRVHQVMTPREEKKTERREKVRRAGVQLEASMIASASVSSESMTWAASESVAVASTNLLNIKEESRSPPSDAAKRTA